MNKLLYSILILFVLQSCRTQKDVLYFQNIDDVNLNEKNLTNINEYKFQPGDDLIINISVDNPELLTPFKLNRNSDQRAGSGGSSSLTSYTLDENGYIDFPQLGKIKLAGMTREEAIDFLTQKTSLYLKEPIVNIKLSNFRVTVLGDGKGNVIDVKDENTNILEVLAKSQIIQRSSDIDNILLIRKENNERVKYTVNLKDANLFNEPYYFVRQNDIIYVKPSKISTFSFNNAPFAAVSTVLSLGVTIYALFIRK